jgi:long-subunit fatty acid transport protein
LRFARAVALSSTVLALAAPAAAQTLPQDEMDLEGRLNIVLGAGARALGMGGAFLARADDATAASWNPAGLSYLLRPELSLAGASNQVHTQAATEVSSFDGVEPDFVAATWPIRSVAGSIQISYQRVIPFSGRRTIQRTSGTATSLTTLDANGGFDVVALGTGWKVAPTLRVGATLNYWTNGFHQSLTRLGRHDTVFDADFRFRGWNMNLGFIWSPIENLNIGGVAKTPFSGRVRLAKSRTDSFYEPSGALDRITQNAYAANNLRLELPAAYGGGVSWRVRSSLTISADFTHTSWSKARIINFFAIEPTLEPGTPPADPVLYARLPYPLLNMRQSDTVQLRWGAEYVLIRGHVKWPIRAGYFLDRQFFMDSAGKVPILGGVTLGTGVILGPLLMDIAYLREVGTYAQRTLGPTTQSTHRLVFSLNYRHGAPR